MNKDQQVEQELKMFEAFVSNIEWHIKTNKPVGHDLEICRTRVACYKEAADGIIRIKNAEEKDYRFTKEELEKRDRMMKNEIADFSWNAGNNYGQSLLMYNDGIISKKKFEEVPDKYKYLDSLK